MDPLAQGRLRVLPPTLLNLVLLLWRLWWLLTALVWFDFLLFKRGVLVVLQRLDFRDLGLGLDLRSSCSSCPTNENQVIHKSRRSRSLGLCVRISYLPPELWVKNLEEMLRFSLELWLVLLGLPVTAQISHPLTNRFWFLPVGSWLPGRT